MIRLTKIQSGIPMVNMGMCSAQNPSGMQAATMEVHTARIPCGAAMLHILRQLWIRTGIFSATLL